ncbi:hypothetical protein ACOMHN_033617 [Nucella lapillus]
MEPYQDEPLLSVVGAVAEGVDWISESSESAGENEIEIVASTSTVLADNGESSVGCGIRFCKVVAGFFNGGYNVVCDYGPM